MTLLQTCGLTAHYGDFQALFGIDLAIGDGEALALVGANGAGKSTLLRALCGQLAVAPGQIRFDGREIGGLAPDKVVRLGLAMVPEGRRLFPSLTVEENLRLGAYAGRAGPWDLERVFGLFPVLRERRRVAATALSGGQQQMVAIGRALMSNPRLLLCDEISLGLAPVVVKDVYAALPKVMAEGTAVVVVEQDIGQALRFARQYVCLCEGRVVMAGDSATVDRDALRQAYFGV
ncbi:high-affinity branched-chain amino acid transport ATP-binding protein LivF [mine drainage metagenome]|uniref:High-affinity branched-chain amino acid transport ATP-binding protein LivF n=1 Tax=mine drainage metagenome TaxID=410659 RepID=A0A1J5QRJ7_9ZZZZ